MLVRILLILNLMIACLWASAGEFDDFATVDRTSYELYMNQEWEQLSKYGKEAIKQGYDFYFLRIRTGIAYYKLENYIVAATHFQNATNFSHNDINALSYLYYCYLYSGKEADARIVLEKIPEQTIKALNISKASSLEYMYFETGPSLTNNKKNSSDLDLDRQENIYGENTYLRWGYYLALGAKYRPSTRISMYGSYIGVFQGKTKQIMVNDSLTVNEKFPLIQNQFYLNTSIRLKHQVSLVPAFHFLHTAFTSTYARYDESIKNYEYFENSVKSNAYIAHLAIYKDLSLVTMGLEGGYSNLNQRTQVQAGLSLTTYPEGNLNFYTTSKFLIRWQDSLQTGGFYKRFIFYQMIGMRITGKLWAEAFATFGELENYYEKNAYVVYNIPDKILFKWGIQLFYPINDRIDLSLELESLYREGAYLTYTRSGEEYAYQYIPQLIAYTYNNYIIVGGIKWKL